MNTGAYDHEEEMLLYDGAELVVQSVVDEQYEEYELQGSEEDLSKRNGLNDVIANGDA